MKSIEDITPENLKAQQKKLCRLCGHSRSCCEKGKKQKTSRTWKYAFRHHKKNAKKLEVY